MKTTDTFKTTIKSYLDNRAANDELFATAYAKDNKNLDDCINYILNSVKNSGCNGFTDEEVFSMAVHYYDEDNIEAGKPINCKVVVNHTIKLTEEEKQEVRQKAIDELVAQERKKLTSRPERASINPVTEVKQASLF